MPADINIQPTLHTNQRNRLRLRCTFGRNVKQKPTKTDSKKRKLLDKTCAKRYSWTYGYVRPNFVANSEQSVGGGHRPLAYLHGAAVDHKQTQIFSSTRHCRKGLFASKRSTSRFVTRKKQFASYFVAAYARVRDFLQINFCQAAG